MQIFKILDNVRSLSVLPHIQVTLTLGAARVIFMARTPGKMQWPLTAYSHLLNRQSISCLFDSQARNLLFVWQSLIVSLASLHVQLQSLIDNLYALQFITFSNIVFHFVINPPPMPLLMCVLECVCVSLSSSAHLCFCVGNGL